MGVEQLLNWGIMALQHCWAIKLMGVSIMDVVDHSLTNITFSPRLTASLLTHQKLQKLSLVNMTKQVTPIAIHLNVLPKKLPRNPRRSLNILATMADLMVLLIWH